MAEQLGTDGQALPLTTRQALHHGELAPADHRVGAARQLTLLDHLFDFSKTGRGGDVRVLGREAWDGSGAKEALRALSI